MLKPKAFNMENPQEMTPGTFMIRLTIAEQYIDFVRNLPFVSMVHDFTTVKDFYQVWLDTRYDYEEAWLELYNLLEIETQKIELDNIWGLDTEAEE